MRWVAMFIVGFYYFCVFGFVYLGGRALLTGRTVLRSRHTRGEGTLLEGPAARVLGLVYLGIAYWIHQSFVS